MSTATSTPVSTQASSLPVLSASRLVRDRLSDYLALAKPRISVMVLLTVTAGFSLGCSGEFHWLPLFEALIGIGIVATASSTLNQWMELRTDARMPRTANRPLPAGRIHPTEGLALGISLAILGMAWLWLRTNPMTSLLTLASLLLYIGCYTPLKKQTPLCIAVGALPGALPPVLGWTAAGGELNASALALFGILFLWQFPHFFAIAWLYQDDYESAGLKMLPRKRRGGIVGRIATSYALALIPVSMLPRAAGLAGDFYLVTAMILGAAYLYASWQFLREESRPHARQLLLTSLIYLPVLLTTLTIDHWRLLH